MPTTEIRDIHSKVSVRRAAANTAVTAGGGGDNTAVTGVIIDRAALGWPQSVVAAIPFTATLGQGQILTLAYTLQHGDNAGLSDATTFATAGAATVATGGTGGSTETGTFEVGIRLTGARRYVRLNFTPDLDRANTDTAALSAVMVFGGAERLPQ
jgi:hypothetical protein